MDFEIKNMDLVEGCKIALKNRLFVNGWTLRDFLWDIVYSPKAFKKSKICLAYYNEIPIGVCLKIKHKNNDELMVFVRKRYRKNGIGRKLVSIMKTPKSYGNIGIEKSDGKIWKMNNVSYH
jgi:Acetyltransferase (GNAT) domain